MQTRYITQSVSLLRLSRWIRLRNHSIGEGASMRAAFIFVIAAFFVSLAAWLICWPLLPNVMATHWSFSGRPDGFMTRGVAMAVLLAISLLPVIILMVLSVLFQAKNETARRLLRRTAAGMLIPLALLFVYLHGLTLAWNLGARFQFTYFVLPAIGIFIVTTLIGVLPLLKAEVAASREARQTLPRTIWFPAKRYGWGWGFPCAWQGWAVMILWLAGLFGGMAAIATLARNDLKLILFFPFILTMIAILFVISYLKGEKPRWRWGNDGQ